MDEFLALFTNVPPPGEDDPYDSFFITNEAGFRDESYAFRMMKNNLKPPSAESLEAQLSKLKVTENTTPVKKPSIYVPCLSTNMYPKASDLETSEMRDCYFLSLKFMQERINPADNKRLMSYLNRIKLERAEFQEFVSSLWRRENCQRYLVMPSGPQTVMDQYWQSKVNAVLTLYPNFYNQVTTVPLVYDDSGNPVKMEFEKHLFKSGDLPEFKVPELDKKHEVRVSKENTNLRSSDETGCHYQRPVSFDETAENLAVQNEANFVLSSSSFKKIIDNFPPNFSNSWELPIVVKEYKSDKSMKKVIFIDKALPATNISVAGKSKWFTKKSITSFLRRVGPKNSKDGKNNLPNRHKEVFHEANTTQKTSEKNFSPSHFPNKPPVKIEDSGLGKSGKVKSPATIVSCLNQPKIKNISDSRPVETARISDPTVDLNGGSNISNAAVNDSELSNEIGNISLSSCKTNESISNDVKVTSNSLSSCNTDRSGNKNIEATDSSLSLSKTNKSGSNLIKVMNTSLSSCTTSEKENNDVKVMNTSKSRCKIDERGSNNIDVMNTSLSSDNMNDSGNIDVKVINTSSSSCDVSESGCSEVKLDKKRGRPKRKLKGALRTDGSDAMEIKSPSASPVSSQQNENIDSKIESNTSSPKKRHAKFLQEDNPSPVKRRFTRSKASNTSIDSQTLNFSKTVSTGRTKTSCLRAASPEIETVQTPYSVDSFTSPSDNPIQISSKVTTSPNPPSEKRATKKEANLSLVQQKPSRITRSAASAISENEGAPEINELPSDQEQIDSSLKISVRSTRTKSKNAGALSNETILKTEDTDVIMKSTSKSKRGLKNSTSPNLKETSVLRTSSRRSARLKAEIQSKSPEKIQDDSKNEESVSNDEEITTNETELVPEAQSNENEKGDSFESKVEGKLSLELKKSVLFDDCGGSKFKGFNFAAFRQTSPIKKESTTPLPKVLPLQAVKSPERSKKADKVKEPTPKHSVGSIHKEKASKILLKPDEEILVMDIKENSAEERTGKKSEKTNKTKEETSSLKYEEESTSKENVSKLDFVSDEDILVIDLKENTTKESASLEFSSELAGKSFQKSKKTIAAKEETFLVKNLESPPKTDVFKVTSDSDEDILVMDLKENAMEEQSITTKFLSEQTTETAIQSKKMNISIESTCSDSDDDLVIDIEADAVESKTPEQNTILKESQKDQTTKLSNDSLKTNSPKEDPINFDSNDEILRDDSDTDEENLVMDVNDEDFVDTTRKNISPATSPVPSLAEPREAQEIDFSTKENESSLFPKFNFYREAGGREDKRATEFTQDLPVDDQGVEKSANQNDTNSYSPSISSSTSIKLFETNPTKVKSESSSKPVGDLSPEKFSKDIIGTIKDEIKCKESSENAPLNSSSFHIRENVSYNLWTLRKEDINSKILMKCGARSFKLLIRTKNFGILRKGPIEQVINVASKIEYNPEYGASCWTVSEAAQGWADLFIKPNTNLLRVRVTHSDYEVMMTENMRLQDACLEMKRLHNITPQHCHNTLYSVLVRLADLEKGNYILRHEPRDGAFAVLNKASKTRYGSYILQRLYQKPASSSLPVMSPYIPIDSFILTPKNHFQQTIPATFYARNFPKKSSDSKSKSNAPTYPVNKKWNVKKKKNKGKNGRNALKGQGQGQGEGQGKGQGKGQGQGQGQGKAQGQGQEK